MVRTRATASAAPAAPLSAAPRRRLKVTPIEKEEVKKPTKPAEEEPKPTTRATRGKKAVAEPPKATKTTASKPKGRPKKADTITEDAEPAVEQPKRATRSVRATATTASSAAKEKPAARSTRTTQTTAKEQPVEEVHSIKDTAPPTKPVPKKKVTFEDILADDKENQPLTTRAGKKVIAPKSIKSADKATGLRAKPVRKPIAATRSSKRTKDQASDDEEEKPRKKIQRVLTPKKITQIARAATPEDASDDELNGGKTPVRDLSLSPRRPHTTTTAEAIATTLSPAKKLDFAQSLLNQSTKKGTEDGVGVLMSPARRPPTSPDKLFSQSDLHSPVRALSNDNRNALASPARRLMDSPAKLLFPNASKHDQRVHLSKTASNLFQSPKRSLAFDPTSMFSQSAVKPQKSDLSKSSFLSSPAKRTAQFSPMKRSTTPQSTTKTAQPIIHSSDELDVNAMDVTELIQDIAEEITVTSHQRASVSPIRTYKLSADELHMDFDDSILDVRSPLKLAKTPSKPAVQVEAIPVVGHDADATELDQEMEELMPSMQSTPRTINHHDSSSINPRVLETEDDPTPQDPSQDLTMTDEGDDTIILPENGNVATPRSVAVSYPANDDSIDELAPSPREDVVTEFLRTPGTPATVAEHELTMMAQTSPGKDEIQDVEPTPVPSPAPAVVTSATFTPNMPIPRKFHMHTVISKVPLKPEAEDSPVKLSSKKRKRPHSLGAQPEFVDISDRPTPAKAVRTPSSLDATSGRASLIATPIAGSLQRTPGSKMSSAKTSRRVVSTPVPRTPLTEFANSDVLAGVVVYVDVRTSEGADASAIYLDLLHALGAKVVKEWKDDLTHIVYKDGSPKILEKARLSELDVKVVGVSWPLDCEAQKAWVDESDYLLNLTPTDQVLQSVTKSARRKSMEPSMLIADGSGSVKRSRSKALRRSSIKPPVESTPQSCLDNDESMATVTTPSADPAKKAAELEKNSLTAAWKSINATHNLGEDTPARRTLELLQKSYEVESGWDDSLLSSNDDEETQNQETTPHQPAEVSPDPEILETGLTPAPYKVQKHIGSAPPKATNNGMMSYRERVEEMERREMRDNAFGTNKGGRGVGAKKGGNGKRMTMFGFEPIKQSPLGQ